MGYTSGDEKSYKEIHTLALGSVSDFTRPSVYKSKQGGKDQELIQLSKTPDTIKHNIQEIKETSPFPAGGQKAAMNRRESMTNTKHE